MTVLQQIVDLRAEADEFDRLLAGLKDDDWRRATLFKGWTPDDIVQHLHMGDRMGLASATGDAAFAALRADIQAKRATSRTGSRRRASGWQASPAPPCASIGARRFASCATRLPPSPPMRG